MIYVYGDESMDEKKERVCAVAFNHQGHFGHAAGITFPNPGEGYCGLTPSAR